MWVRTLTEHPGKLYGEVGILPAVLHEAIPTAIFLRMQYHEKRYMVFLAVRDAVSSLEINKLFNRYVGRPIEEIGDLDVTYLL